MPIQPVGRFCTFVFCIPGGEISFFGKRYGNIIVVYTVHATYSYELAMLDNNLVRYTLVYLYSVQCTVYRL